MEFLLQLQQLPSKSGVYFFKDKKKKIIYIGKAKNLKKRVSSYFKTSFKDPKTQLLAQEIFEIEHIQVASELEAFLLEANLIKKYKPYFNFKMVDDKSYPYIKIVKKNTPYILTTRRVEKDEALYFGPYPDLISVKTVLKLIRKIFPYQTVSNHSKRQCLFGHIGLCPCVNVFQENLKEYQKNIKKIINFLQGDKEKLLKILEKEKQDEIRKENFEKAQEIQKKIEMINYVTSQNYEPFRYIKDFDFYNKRIKEELISLKTILSESFSNLNHLERIECYDISNIQGKYATGSLVVFINGQESKKDYRRFKIQSSNTPDDYKMMQEILERRLKHKEWEIPNLIIVDGGKGQLSAAQEIINKQNLKIPAIGLAKKEETIIIKDKEIKLPKSTQGVNLIRRIRDEAHRFAISYHKILRNKWLTSNI